MKYEMQGHKMINQKCPTSLIHTIGIIKSSVPIITTVLPIYYEVREHLNLPL